MTKKEKGANMEELESRVAEAGRQLGAFGAASEAEVRNLQDGVRTRMSAADRPFPRWALAAGLAALLGLVVTLGVSLQPAAPPVEADDPVLVLMEEVTDITYPPGTSDDSPYEDQLAEVADWLIVGEVRENGAEEYPAAYEWLDSVLSNDLEDEVL